MDRGISGFSTFVILACKSEILHKVIHDELSDDTSPMETLAIYKTLDELIGKLQNALQVESEAAKAAHEFLRQGPGQGSRNHA